MASSTPARYAALADVRPASSMPVFAHERLLPVHPVLAPLLTGSEGAQGSSVGLVRGQTVVCAGSAAVSCALGLVAEATRTGSWAAIVGLPSLGVMAAAAIGVSLDRTVFVSDHDLRVPFVDRNENRRGGGTTKDARGDVASALSALIDGVDLVVVSRRFVSTLSASLVRRLQNRAQSKGSVLVVIGDPVATSVDIRFVARTVSWEGVGEGYGHLRRRLVAVEVDGRRCPRPRAHTVWMPDATGGLASVDRLAAVDDGVVIPLHRGNRSHTRHDQHDRHDRRGDDR